MDEAAAVHMETMGEYPTSIQAIRLHNEGTDEIAWEAIAHAEEAQVWNILVHQEDGLVEISSTRKDAMDITSPVGTKINKGDHLRIDVFYAGGKSSSAKIECFK